MKYFLVQLPRKSLMITTATGKRIHNMISNRELPITMSLPVHTPSECTTTMTTPSPPKAPASPAPARCSCGEYIVDHESAYSSCGVTTVQKCKEMMSIVLPGDIMHG